MTALAAETPSRVSAPAPLLFGVAVFVSAALVFIVQPMVARMILPRLGGSSAVWNVSLAFFQLALLAGYAYAHLLQRIGSLRGQMAVHLAVLAAAALILPLRISSLLGEPSVEAPALWLAGVLALSIGAPFAALSATAPLVQAWYARLFGRERDPYVLYAASNLGSLLALLAYPVLAEPFLGLARQSVAWSGGYGLFVLILLLLMALAWRSPALAARRPAVAPAAPAVTWRDRAAWLLLAAAPCSLLSGVTAHLTSDIASAPFLWVIPLALYLITFIIAFQSRPLIQGRWALLLQAGLAPVAVLLYTVSAAPWTLQVPIHLAAFFFTALVCVFSLADRRPHPSRLTEFYLWMSIGGVVGGGFNAFVAPALFNGVWEYPIVLVLASLARPSRDGRMSVFQWGWLAWGLLAAAILLWPIEIPRTGRLALLMTPGICALLLRDRTLAFTAAFAALAAGSYLPGQLRGGHERHRSFFGVVQIGEAPAPRLGGVRILVHGTTLHGAQGLDPARRCVPATYYAAATPIGQAFRTEQARRPAMSIGAVGLGTGTVAAYVRPTDRLRFFEIDPLMASIAFDPARFSYVDGCARGPIALTLGDARLSLDKTPSDSFDLLLVDAFSSDSVPTHLLTVEAVRTYLRVLKPDGVVVLHLSNRNLELSGPATAAVRQAGGVMLVQDFYSDPADYYVQSSSQVLIAARSRPALAPYIEYEEWTLPMRHAPAWTDDYVNVAGALVARLREQRGW